MTHASSLAAVALVLGACVPHRATIGRRSALDDKALRAELAERCGTCHDGDPSRPSYDESAPLTKDGALHAALALSSERMPPTSAGAAMPMQTRVQLIAALCDYGAPDPALCRESYDPRLRSPLVRSPANFLRRAATILGAADLFADPYIGYAPDKGPLPYASFFLSGHLVKTNRVMHLDPTLEAVLIAFAADRCTAATAGKGPPAYEACVAAIIGHELVRSEPPR